MQSKPTPPKRQKTEASKKFEAKWSSFEHDVNQRVLKRKFPGHKKFSLLAETSSLHELEKSPKKKDKGPVWKDLKIQGPLFILYYPNDKTSLVIMNRRERSDFEYVIEKGMKLNLELNKKDKFIFFR